MVDSGSNTSDSEEKKDTVSELPALPKNKSKGKTVKRDPGIISNVELITLKTKRIVIDEAKASKSTAVSKQKAPLDGENIENAVDSIYHLRSGYKGRCVDATSKSRVARKRKGKEKKTDFYQDPDSDFEEVCKRFKKVGNIDDNPDKDGAGAEVRKTRSSSRKRKLIST